MKLFLAIILATFHLLTLAESQFLYPKTIAGDPTGSFEVKTMLYSDIYDRLVISGVSTNQPDLVRNWPASNLLWCSRHSAPSTLHWAKELIFPSDAAQGLSPVTALAIHTLTDS
jgi:hypothetical protein